MKTSYIAKGGLYTALGIVLIYLTSILPTNKLFVLGAASCIIPICIITCDIKTSIAVYFATFILSLLLPSSKAIAIIYALLFGAYGFIKYYVEYLRRLPLEILLKLLFLNTSIFILYNLYTKLFAQTIKANINIIILFIIAQIVFIVYDYAVTLFIDYFRRHFIDKIG